MAIEKRLDEISEIVLICKNNKCGQPVGTWTNIPPCCPHCATPAEKGQRGHLERERIAFIEQLMNGLRTAVVKPELLPFKITLHLQARGKLKAERRRPALDVT